MYNVCYFYTPQTAHKTIISQSFFFYSGNKEDYISNLTRDNVQLLVNEIWELPTERVEECVVAKLPAPAFVLPRSRKCPAAKELTKWERFAKEKGIQNKKKDKKVFDKELGVSILSSKMIPNIMLIRI